MDSPGLGRHIIVRREERGRIEDRVGIVLANRGLEGGLIVRILDPGVEMLDQNRVLPITEGEPSPAGFYWAWPPRN